MHYVQEQGRYMYTHDISNTLTTCNLHYCKIPALSHCCFIKIKHSSLSSLTISKQLTFSQICSKLIPSSVERKGFLKDSKHVKCFQSDLYVGCLRVPVLNNYFFDFVFLKDVACVTNSANTRAH